MGDQNTDAMNGKRPFEERVFARFDALDLSMRVMDSSMRDMDARLQKLEVRTYDTKPIWEQALKEIVATRREHFCQFVGTLTRCIVSLGVKGNECGQNRYFCDN